MEGDCSWIVSPGISYSPLSLVSDFRYIYQVPKMFSEGDALELATAPRKVIDGVRYPGMTMSDYEVTENA